MVEQLISTKRSNLKEKEYDMGDMSWLSHLVTTGAREELEEFLKDKGFKKPKFAAEQFLKAQEEIERDGMKKRQDAPIITGDRDTDALLEDERASQEDGEPTTADKHNNKWLQENK